MMKEGNPILLEADPIVLGSEQELPLGLIVNELVINAIKYGSTYGPVTAKLGRSNEGIRLAVRDRGVLPPGYDPSGASGFVMRMIASTVAQIGGRLDASSMAGETEFAVTRQLKVFQPTLLQVIDGGR